MRWLYRAARQSGLVFGCLGLLLAGQAWTAELLAEPAGIERKALLIGNSRYAAGALSNPEGNGVPKDWEQAVLWYRKAAEQGYSHSQCAIGWMYETGNGGLPEDREQAVSWYRKAATGGGECAQQNLARLREAFP